MIEFFKKIKYIIMGKKERKFWNKEIEVINKKNNENVGKLKTPKLK